MTLMAFVKLVGLLVAVGYGGIRGYERYQSRKLDKKYPEKKA